MADGSADINRCPPGGAEGIVRLAALTGRAVLPLDPARGSEGPRALAVIDEAWCIGCTLCIKACPVDCIVGASKLMHTVIDPLCTGCELCVPVCPVDCIAMVPVTGSRTGWQAWSAAQADEARERYAFHRWRAAARAARERRAPGGQGRGQAGRPGRPQARPPTRRRWPPSAPSSKPRGSAPAPARAEAGRPTADDA